VVFLSRVLTVLLGAALLVGAGVVHGLWTNRWEPSEALEEAARRLAELPDDVGSWKGEPYEQEAEALQLAGAVGHYSRTFTDPVTGEQVMVVLLAGKPSRMVVHRPEHCYRAAGYTLAGPAEQYTIDLAKGREAELWTGLFVRDEATGPAQLRAFWTWYAGSGWVAPDNPRWSFARQRVLYKLYVIRNVAGPQPLTEDPCVRLLAALLPRLEQALSDQ
jgi:hypothetical protein